MNVLDAPKQAAATQAARVNASAAQGSAVSKLQRRITALGNGVKRRWSEASLVYQYRIEKEQERSQASTSDEQIASGQGMARRLSGYLFGVSGLDWFPLYEGTNGFVRSASNRLSPWRNDPMRDCDLELRVIEDGIRLVMGAGAKPELVHSNRCIEVGNESYIVKILPENYRMEVAEASVGNRS